MTFNIVDMYTEYLQKAQDEDQVIRDQEYKNRLSRQTMSTKKWLLV